MGANDYAASLPAAVVIGGSQQANDNNSTASTASGGNYAGKSGGSTSKAITDRERYMQIYKAVAQVLGIKFNTKIANLAFKNRQPGSGFLALTRRLDKNYVKTAEFKSNASSFIARWQQYFPNQPVNYAELKRAVRGGYTSDQYDQLIQKTAAFKAAYPFFKPGVNDVQKYQAYDKTFTNLMQSSFNQAPTMRQRELFFKYDLTPAEVQSRADELTTNAPAAQWMFGNKIGQGEQLQNAQLFDEPGSNQRRSTFQNALKINENFNQSQEASAAFSKDNQTNKLAQIGI